MKDEAIVRTRSDTDMAAMRRGCVQTMLQSVPRPDLIACSSRYCGTYASYDLNIGLYAVDRSMHASQDAMTAVTLR